MKIKMTPNHMGAPSGITTVVQKYMRHLPGLGIEIVNEDEDYEVEVVHAGVKPFDSVSGATLAVCHGLYWGDDREPSPWEKKANRNVVKSLREAKVITTPTDWVAQTIRRDMRREPVVVPHGIDWDEWQVPKREGKYILGYYKNRDGGVCDPTWMNKLAIDFPKELFLGTFCAENQTPNIKVTGPVPHDEMKEMIHDSLLCISTTKETFGLLILEAMAAGKPVLAFNEGGATELIEHGVNGYLATPGDLEDLKAGLSYCLEHRDILGENGREMARKWTWKHACEKLVEAIRLTAKMARDDRSGVSCVIPAYNGAGTLKRAVSSVVGQADEIIIVNDGSTDSTGDVADELADEFDSVVVIHKENGKVSSARNAGVAAASNELVFCLDMDDAIKPGWVDVCREALLADNSLGATYTGLEWVKPDGSTGISEWPGRYNYDNQVRRKNQIPTCALFRKTAWAGVGGYRSRYCPTGAGSEDADFWTRMGAAGWGALKVTAEPLFTYSWMSGHTSREGYSEVDWLDDKPYADGGEHPLASVASPKAFSHPVFQYDTPVISIVIPVGPYHNDEDTLFDVLDSVVGQTMRHWECIVVNDSGKPVSKRVLDAFSFMTFLDTAGARGPSHARNWGATVAKAPLILFFDADDRLLPKALGTLYSAHMATGHAVYSDYIGVSIAEESQVNSLDVPVVSYDKRTKVLKTRGRLFDYDYDRAARQPELPPYVWNSIVTLFPRRWHFEIGGFVQMESWEDWLYFLKMSKMCYCFTRVPEPLFEYSFIKGKRRDYAAPREGNEDIHKRLVNQIKKELSNVQLRQ